MPYFWIIGCLSACLASSPVSSIIMPGQIELVEDGVFSIQSLPEKSDGIGQHYILLSHEVISHIHIKTDGIIETLPINSLPPNPSGQSLCAYWKLWDNNYNTGQTLTLSFQSCIEKPDAPFTIIKTNESSPVYHCYLAQLKEWLIRTPEENRYLTLAWSESTSIPYIHVKLQSYYRYLLVFQTNINKKNPCGLYQTNMLSIGFPSYLLTPQSITPDCQQLDFWYTYKFPKKDISSSLQESITPHLSRAHNNDSSNLAAKPKGKRLRTAFTQTQKDVLESLFAKYTYINYNTKMQVSQQTGLSIEIIRNWFHNRRAKAKKRETIQNQYNISQMTFN